MNNIDKILICEFCGKEITEDYRKDKRTPQRFCSRSCANSYSSLYVDYEKLKDSFCTVCGKPIKIKHNATSGRCDRCKVKHIYRYSKDCVLGKFERSMAYIQRSTNLERLGFDFNKDWESEFFKARNLLYKKYYEEKMSYLELKKYFKFPSHKIIPDYLKLFGLFKIRSISEGLRISFQKGVSKLNIPKTSKYLSGWKDGYYYRSSYELNMIGYLESKGIDFQCNTFKVIYRSSKDNNYHTAFPDFYVPSMNLIIEMKGENRYDEVDLKDRYESIKKSKTDFLILFCDSKYLKDSYVFKGFKFLNYFGNEERLNGLLEFFGIKK